MGDDFEVVGTMRVEDDGSLSNINSQLDDMSSKTEGASGATSALGSVADFVWGGLIVEGINKALDLVTEFVSESITGAENLQNTEAILGAVVANVGGKTGETTDKLNQYAAALAQTTVYSKAQVLAAEQMGLKFDNITSDTFPKVLQAAADIATSMGTSLPGAMQMLGRNLQDPINGFGSLTRVIGQVDPAIKAQVISMAKAGDIAGADALILSTVENKLKGVAQAAGETFTGAWARLTNSISDSMEEGLQPFMVMAADLVEKVLKSPALLQFADGLRLLGDNLIHMTGPFEIVRPLLAFFGDWWAENGPAISIQANRIFQSLEQLWVEVSPQIAQLVANQLPKFEAWFTKNGPNIQRVVQAIATVFVEVLVPAIKIAWGVIGPILDALITVILDVATLILDVAAGNWKDAWSMIKDIAVSVWNGLSNALLGGATALVKLVGGTPNDIGITWTNNWHLFTSVISKSVTLAMGVIKGTLSSWMDIGKQLVNGMVTGVANAASSLAKAVLNAVQSTINQVHAALGIHSPSRVFADIGQNMMLGMAQGIGKGLAIPISVLSSGLPALSSAGSGGLSTSIYGGNTSYSRQQHFGAVNNFYVSSRQSPSDVLKNLRKVG